MFDHLILGASILWVASVIFLIFAIGTSILTFTTWLLLPSIGAFIFTCVLPLALYVAMS